MRRTSGLGVRGRFYASGSLKIFVRGRRHWERRCLACTGGDARVRRANRPGLAVGGVAPPMLPLARFRCSQRPAMFMIAPYCP